MRKQEFMETLEVEGKLQLANEGEAHVQESGSQWSDGSRGYNSGRGEVSLGGGWKEVGRTQGKLLTE